MLETPEYPEPLTMGQRSGGANQQESRLHWLGGFIDGEGSFEIIRKRSSGKVYYYPILDLVNTNPLDIDEALQIISSICGFHVEVREPKKPTHKRLWRIRVLGFSRCQKLLRVIIPFLVGKKEEAEMLLRFIEAGPSADRETMKRELSAIRNPQRLYARQYAILKIAS